MSAGTIPFASFSTQQYLSAFVATLRSAFCFHYGPCPYPSTPWQAVPIRVLSVPTDLPFLAASLHKIHALIHTFLDWSAVVESTLLLQR